MMTRRVRAAAVLVPLVVLAAGALTGCGDLEQAARDTVDSAACTAAQEAVDGLTTRVDEAVAELGADPAAARAEPTGLREAVAAAEQGLSGEAQQALDDARGALDTLVEQADAAADGTQVDDVVVDEARQELDTAVDDLTTVC